MTRFVVVPQWQGSPSTRAMALIDGADAIAGDLPSSSCLRVEVPFEAGESLGTGVARASALQRTRIRVDEALQALPSDRVIVIGGDDGVAVPAISHVADTDLAVVWFDAHGALHAPNEQRSRAYSSMALRSTLSDIAPGLGIASGRLAAERIVLAGARALDDEEQAFMAERGIRHVTADQVAHRIADTVASLGASRVYIHIDLDVLDPAHIAGVADAQPFGLEAAALIDAIASVRAALPLAGASIGGFAPHTPAAAVDDMGTILRVVGALAS
ncbi:arginase family protein [Microbacterium amylolyticum]|uniref:Arginase n=1 Tax=Microbacterium amylolyticum TaxID=936337 RepID=A0ABS4ZG58_9MICO|nr:arginase family protein [Microbacterium amylolyticum]MBP2436267.1 arginase [Microbacterium amylolyticum]